jgi:hypothetical protein
MVQQVRVVATAEGLTQVQQRVGTFVVDASGAFCGLRWSHWEAMPTVLVSESELLPDQMIIDSRRGGAFCGEG